MYHLQLVKGSEAYNAIKFTVNLFYNVISQNTEAAKQPGSFIETLKVQMDLHGADEVIHLSFDLEVLKQLSGLVAVLAKKKLEASEDIESMAAKTEQQTGILIWNQYLTQADNYFKELKSFIHEDEWVEIEKILNG
jgi:hypothetical protein